MAFGITFLHIGKRISATRVEMDQAAPTLEGTVKAAKELVRMKKAEVAIQRAISEKGCRARADGTSLCFRTPECGECPLG